MGRGRQRAKHTKVARELKYNVPATDYGRLERELTGGKEEGEANPELSKWAEYLDENDEADDLDDADEDSADDSEEHLAEGSR